VKEVLADGGVAANRKIFGIVYRAINITNGKSYIGQTIFPLDKRKSEHEYMSTYYTKTKIAFYYAIRKYGVDNFKWEVIDSAINQEELNTKEVEAIKSFRTFLGFEDSKGYNMTLGGGGRSGYAHSAETRLKISSAHKGKRTYGDSHVAKPVLQFDKDGKLIAKHPSAKNGADSVGCNLQNITDCCRGYKQKTAYGYIWIYEEDFSEDFLLSRLLGLPNFNVGARKIIQMDLDGKILNTFDSAYSAAQIIDADRSGIIKCCRGKIGKHKGFIWKYLEDL
jgi:group I intron endonuclease